MKIIAPTQSIDFKVTDLHGEEFSLSDYHGKAVILSFFRNSTCPFCLKRVFDLSSHHQRWRKNGIEVIVVFTSNTNDILKFYKNRFDRLRVIPDPQLEIYNKYGIEESFAGFAKGLAFKIPTILQGLKRGASIDRNNPNGLILPADFLIDPDGQIIESWYGKDAADNIPMDHIYDFVRSMVMRKLRQ